MDITGKITLIGATQQVSDRFKKRELVIEYATNPQYPEELVFEFIQDRTDLLDGYAAGQTVQVWFDVSGRKWTAPDGAVRRFISLKGWRLQSVEGTSNPIPDEPPPLTAAQEIPKSAGDDLGIPF